MAPRKAQERADLKKLRSITLTIEATESNLQRLAAYLIFCEHLDPLVKASDEECAEAPPAALTVADEAKMIDYDVVRRDIAGKLGAYVERFGAEDAKRLLKDHGAERLSLIEDTKLLALHNVMRDALAIPAR